MAERFKLETVLKHRKHLEEIAHKVFGEASRKWNDARKTLDSMTRNRLKYQHELRHKMNAEAVAGELLLYHRYLDRLQNEIEAQNDLVESLAVEREEKRAQLLVALKNRKIIEKLKERYREQEAQRAQRQEQKHLNEAALNRYQGQSGPPDRS